MVATTIGSQNKYEDTKLRYFSKNKDQRQTLKDLVYWNYMAKLTL